MSELPILYRNQEILFDEKTQGKLKYLNWKRKGKPSRYSDIVNEALENFFEREFPKLDIELYRDLESEYKQKREEERLKEQAEESEFRRVLQLAKKRIIEREIAKIREEEKKSGNKIQLPKDIKRILHNYKI